MGMIDEDEQKLLEGMLAGQAATIREAALRQAAAECQIVLDNAKSFGLPQMAIGAAQCREVILALIGSK
jgi:hypothetical protein